MNRPELERVWDDNRILVQQNDALRERIRLLKANGNALADELEAESDSSSAKNVIEQWREYL